MCSKAIAVKSIIETKIDMDCATNVFAFADAVVRTDSGTRRKFKQIDAVEGAVDGLNQNSVSCAPCSRQKETDLSN